MGFICSKSKILIFQSLEPPLVIEKVITNDALFAQDKRHDIHKNKITLEVSDMLFVCFFKEEMSGPEFQGPNMFKFAYG